MAKSDWVSRQPPRSRPTTFSPESASSLARMVPVSPTPTVTTSTGLSLVAMPDAPPCGREHHTPAARAAPQARRSGKVDEHLVGKSAFLAQGAGRGHGEEVATAAGKTGE